MTHITTSYQVCNILTDQSFPTQIETIFDFQEALHRRTRNSIYSITVCNIHIRKHCLAYCEHKWEYIAPILQKRRRPTKHQFHWRGKEKNILRVIQLYCKLTISTNKMLLFSF